MAEQTEGAEKALRIHRSSFVTPSETTPTHSICLTQLDQLPFYTPMIFLYRASGDPDFFSTEALIIALSKVLVPFYPFAGELGRDEHGRVELKCTGKGVRFVSASCNFTMEEFGGFTPRPAVVRFFLPELPSANPPCPVAIVQVTRFKCGCVCVAWAIHHMIGDGQACFRFTNAWADVTRGSDPAAIRRPFLDRSALKPRSPPSIQFPHAEYDFCINSAVDGDVDHLYSLTPSLTTSLVLSPSQVAALRARAGGKSTVFSAVVAHTWKCTCKARRLAADQPTRAHIVGDIRSRLRPPLPSEFLGNAVLYMRAEARAGSTLADLGREIERSNARLGDEEYLRSLIDYLETKKEVLRRSRRILPPTDIFAVNLVNVPMYHADFGWGKPCYIHLAGEPGNIGSIYVLRSFDGEKGGVLVTVKLEKEYMHDFKRHFYEDLKSEGQVSGGHASLTSLHPRTPSARL